MEPAARAAHELVSRYRMMPLFVPKVSSTWLGVMSEGEADPPETFPFTVPFAIVASVAFVTLPAGSEIVTAPETVVEFSGLVAVTLEIPGAGYVALT